jgi:hypothetical protein
VALSPASCPPWGWCHPGSFAQVSMGRWHGQSTSRVTWTTGELTATPFVPPHPTP